MKLTLHSDGTGTKTNSGIRFCLVALMITASVPALAQSGSNASSDKEVIAQLLKRIELLEASQKQIQEKMGTATAPAPVELAAPVAAAPPVEAPPPAPADVLEDTSVTADPDSTFKLGPVQFRGYSDVNYGRALFEKLPDSSIPGAGLRGSPNSLNIGDFDLFVNSRISSHWSVLGELLITSDFSNEFGAEIDRLLITYRKNDYFNISIGKFNTALGYYPNAFHRARYFQTATGRPVMYADEDNGGILPLHSVGVTATGKIPSEMLGLHWVAEVANGRPADSVTTPVQNFTDQNNGKAVNFALYARPERWNGFQAGVSYYRDTLHPSNLTTAVGQTILTGHIVYVGSRLEWLNEGSVVTNTQNGRNIVSRSTTMYTQLSRSFGKNTPYARYDYQNVPNTDPIFSLLGRRNGPSVGLNRRLANYVVLKLQYGRLATRENNSVNDFQAQLAFAF